MQKFFLSVLSVILFNLSASAFAMLPINGDSETGDLTGYQSN